jgi:hypothetical protein
MAVVDGSGRRMAIDRDDDGVFDQSELEQGSDPFDISSPSNLPPPENSPLAPLAFTLYSGGKADLAIDMRALDSPRHPNRRITFSFVDPQEVPAEASIDATGSRLIWDIPKDEPARSWMIRLRVFDNARPGPEDIPLELHVRELRILTDPTSSNLAGLRWGDGNFFPTPMVHRYEIQVAESMDGPWWRSAFVHRYDQWPEWNQGPKAPRRFYRILASH